MSGADAPDTGMVGSKMTVEKAKLIEDLRGDSFVTVVPSAAGMPLPTSLTPPDAVKHSVVVFQAASQALSADARLV